MKSAGAGMRLGQIVRPLDTVAAYIPSGRYPLPSTIMMTAIPAQVAGVPNICVASPQAGSRGLRHGGPAGTDPGFPDGRSAGHRRLCLWHAHGAARRPHRGSGQYLCGRRQEIAGGRSGNRFRRRPHGDPDRRRRGRSAPPGGRPAGAGGARCGCLGGAADHFEAAGRGGGEGSGSPTRRTAHGAGGVEIHRAQFRHRAGELAGGSHGNFQPLRAGASQHSR